MQTKWYSPLTADFIEPGYDWNEEPPVLEGAELVRYQNEIMRKLEKENENGQDWHGNLMDYFDGSEEAAQNVTSAIVSVEEKDGALCGVCTLEHREPLTEAAREELRDYITGQYSDGFGEGFEQRDIEVECGVLNVHLWQPGGFQMQEAPAFENAAVPERPGNCPEKPRMELLGHDGNIFSVLGRAAKQLRNAGQEEQAKQMCSRVYASDSYNAALQIVSEYVHTELSSPAAEPPAKKRGEASR